MTTYGQRIEWTRADGCKEWCEASGHSSQREARLAAIAMARNLGWTPPRWWQWWRWDDTRIEEAK